MQKCWIGLREGSIWRDSTLPLSWKGIRPSAISFAPPGLFPACQLGHGIRWHAHFLFVSPLYRPLSFMKAGVSPLSSRDALTLSYTGLVLWMPEDMLSENMSVARAKGPCRLSCPLYTKLSLKSLLGSNLESRKY